MSAPQELHPVAASLVPYDEGLRDDQAYFRKLGVAYDADALIDLLKRKKPKSAMPAACHSLADLNAKHAVLGVGGTLREDLLRVPPKRSSRPSVFVCRMRG